MSDRRARFQAQVLPHLDAAYNLARWLARPPLDADDIVQDAMLRAFRAFDTFRGDNAKPWLLCIVRNCFLTAAGNARRTRNVPIAEDDQTDADDPAWTADAPDPESAAISAGERRRLDEVLALLPREFREVLVLREMEDLSYREIAQITGAPIGTVMSRLARARGLLKEKWHNDLERNAYVLQ
ncbi:MAG TPA: sigma-70 family RNA polymerase sigma factor [Rhizomicrobium sp.]|nr:sigma-70 family RNA polymerase sigma factor [Rhizomicrobium sp.]